MSFPRDLCRERFIQFLLEGKTQNDAYVLAGFKSNAGNAGRLYRSPYVQERIAKAKVEVGKKIDITVERILARLAELAFGDFRQLYKDDGTLKLPHEMDEETAALVAAYEAGKVKLRDPMSALEKLGKHLGMFAERVEHSGPDGGPIVMEDRDLARLIAFQLTKSTKSPAPGV